MERRWTWICPPWSKTSLRSCLVVLLNFVSPDFLCSHCLLLVLQCWLSSAVDPDRSRHVHPEEGGVWAGRLHVAVSAALREGRSCTGALAHCCLDLMTLLGFNIYYLTQSFKGRSKLRWGVSDFLNVPCWIGNWNVQLCWLASLLQGIFYEHSLFNLLIFHAVPDVLFFKEEAISALEKFPTPASRLTLTDILEQDQCFYKVRMQACFCLSKVGVFVCAHMCVWERLREKKLTHHSHIECQQHLSCWGFVYMHTSGCIFDCCCRSSKSLSSVQQGATVHSNPLWGK